MLLCLADRFEPRVKTTETTQIHGQNTDTENTHTWQGHAKDNWTLAVHVHMQNLNNISNQNLLYAPEH